MISNVEVYLRIITSSDQRNGILVFLGDDGELPFFNLSLDNLDFQIESILNSFFYPSDVEALLMSKQISHAETDRSKQCLKLFYNFIALNTNSKQGSFIYYDKKNIELFRLLKQAAL